ncbi:CDP-archaeol synthase [Candidatus Peregrinibacteria bacterium]|nr:CDP-archaeol synthase [Candidatus Peregrinibacteria bacterium]
MAELIFISILFFLPAYIANMMPVIGQNLPFSEKIKKTAINEKLFGKNKTWFGIVFGILISTLICYIIYQILLMYSASIHGEEYLKTVIFKSSYFFYLNIPSAVTISSGALLGDLIESYFKRRIGLKPGYALPFFDQTDFIFGAWIMYMIYISIPYFNQLFFKPNYDLNLYFYILLTGLIITPFLHLSANVIAYKLRLKKVWW